MLKSNLVLIIAFLMITACRPSSTSTSLSGEDISISQAADFHSQGYKYIDIRTPKEIENTGTIPGSLLADYKSPDFESKIAALDKEEKYIVFCAAGGRSGRSKPIFQKYNLTMLNMEGGYNQWIKENKQ